MGRGAAHLPTHLLLDVLSGIVLALSPCIFDFADQVYLPHVIFGILEIAVPLLTERQPEGFKYLPGRQTTAHA